jgi:hypothetical protein
MRMALGVVKRVFDAARAVHEAERTRMLGSVNPKDETAVAELLKAMSLPGPRWNVGKRYLPRAQADEISKPAMTMGEMERIVAAARGGKLDKAEAAFVALASVYGYRAGEVAAVNRHDIDFRHLTIFVNTEKGGERRKQVLVPELVPYLKKYDWDIDFSSWKMCAMFKAICQKSGVENATRKNWHSIRRFLETAVRDNLACDVKLARDARQITKIFFRYRLVSSSEMPDRYYSMDSLQADKLALEHNPVVALWA